MSALNPRAIAAQGIGFTPRLVAVQGLWPVPDTGGGFYTPSRRRARDIAKIDDEEILMLISLVISSGLLQ